MSNSIFPFSAIVGQENLKKVLILNLINPKIGGVLIRGEKGTAKSTAVRAAAQLVPGLHVVTLPLNATEDMIVGSIDIEYAIKTGKKRFCPGVLAKAHNGILYIDEINLLDDYLVELILDAAESGWNRVEREGISFAHESRFILVGTMNPEEGEIDPQLLDRFGLCVEVSSEKDIKKRAELILLRERFDNSPEDFIREFNKSTVELKNRIAFARRILLNVRITDEIRKLISKLSIENNVQGHRADLVMEQAAKAIAAFKGRVFVLKEDVLEIAPFALLHRKRKASPPPQSQEKEEEKKEHKKEDKHLTDKKQKSKPTNTNETPKDSEDKDTKEQNRIKSVLEKVFEIGETFQVKRITPPKDRLLRKGSGRRSKTQTQQKQGRYIRSSIRGNKNDIALDATIRAAAPYQLKRSSDSDLYIVIHSEDLRYKIREKRTGNLLIFVVDASGSMGAYGRMRATKGAIMSLLIDAYQKRDRVAMITFRKDKAELKLPPTSSVELASKFLKELPVGGKTPLSSAIVKAYEVVRTELVKDPSIKPIVFFITDGKANVSMGDKNPVEEAILFGAHLFSDKRIFPIIIDTESSNLLKFGLAKKLAQSMDAPCFHIEDLRTDTLINIVKEATG